jgi:sec-independent protein translocase protein TatA
MSPFADVILKSPYAANAESDHSAGSLIQMRPSRVEEVEIDRKRRRAETAARNIAIDSGEENMGLDNPIHIAFLLVLMLVVFGAKRLPEMGRSLGAGMRGFKDAISGEEPPRLAAVVEQTAARSPVDAAVADSAEDSQRGG